MLFYLFLCKIGIIFVGKEIYMDEEIIITEKELEAWPYIRTFLQKGLNIVQKVLNVKETYVDSTGKIKKKSILRRDLTEEEQVLLKLLFRIWRDGELPLYEQKMEGLADNSTQSTIFDVVASEEPTDFDSARDKILDGIDIDNVFSEPKTEEEK